jgi:hypothetical protein
MLRLAEGAFPYSGVEFSTFRPLIADFSFDHFAFRQRPKFSTFRLQNLLEASAYCDECHFTAHFVKFK